jgi:hypothetical protein
VFERGVEEIGFAGKLSCNSSIVSDELEQGCGCPATPATTTSTTKDECTEHTDPTSGNKYYYKASAKADIKTAWKKADCENLK